ncbi:MAG TPA: tetratricopeptide repeat protein [Acidimicrobiales bacterium]|nr:tetratricopeptide repeat protein [Acidimicrobiales bacterium]
MAERPFGAYLARCHAEWLEVDVGGPACRSLDATLVFADVSGFTPLTERLARLGRVGAERLTDILNEVMAGLLDVAVERGGDLLKYGGDALLLLFSGEGHAERAVEAAHAMQKALRPYRRLRTEAGPVSLRMSVGVASGPVHLFLVGDRHRELVVGGPTVDEVVAQESAAEADQVLVASVAAGDVAPVAVAPGAGSAFEAGVPASLRECLAGEAGDGEHRVAVLTFVEARGTSDLLATSGPAAVAAALHDVVCAAQAASEKHGVTFLATDLSSNGTKVLLSAGAPVASTEDEDRMLHTLLDVLDEVADGPLVVRAGVNRGRAFAVDVGSRTRRTYAVMGDATNLAARVMGKSAPGTVLATRSVLDRVRGAYETEWLAPFPVKGKSQLVDAAVVGRAVAAAAAPAADAPLVGREGEVALLREAVASGGRVVELVGEPGIGKSRLLTAFCGLVGGAAMLQVEGMPYATSSPYLALRAPLRRLLGVAPDSPDEAVVRALVAQAPDLEDELPLLAVPFGVELADTATTAAVDPAFRAARIHSLVVDVVERVLPERTALAVEDAHWLDAASSGLLGHLLDLVPERPWVACVTRRDVEGGLRPAGEHVTSVAVEPLGPEAAKSLVRSLGGPGGLVAGSLVERSGGNPLFLQELLAMGDDIAEVPDSVEAVVAARIDTLPRDGRAVLRGAAVLGGRFDAGMLASLLGRDVAGALGAIGGFLVQDESGRYRFRHALLREVAYGGLPFRRRRELHGRAGELVEASAGEAVEEWSDLLSLHFSAAGRDAEAWRYSRLAGERARRTSALVEAETFYRRAVDAAAGLDGVARDEVAAVWEALGDVAELGGRFAVAQEAYRQSRRLRAADAAGLVRLYRKEGRLRERWGRYADGLRWYTRGEQLLASLPAGADATRAAGRMALGRAACRYRQGRYRDCLAPLEAAVAAASAVDDLRTLGNAYYMLDNVHTDLGTGEGARFRERALEIFEELGDVWRQANVFNNLGVDAYYEGRWDDALAHYRRCRDLFARSGDTVQVGSADNNIGEVLSDQGRLVEAEPLFAEALAVFRATRSPDWVAVVTANLGRLAVRAGRFAEGEALLVEAREEFRRLRADAFLLEAEARLAERAVLAGVAAPGCVDDVRRAAVRAGGMPVLLAMLDRLDGWALAQAGRVLEAIDRLEASLARAEAAGADYEAALAYEGLARVGRLADDERVDRWAKEAAAAFDRLGVTATPTVPLPTPEVA